MKRLLQHKLRSGALQFTVFISVVIALILAGALLLAYTHRFFKEQSKAIIENVQLADSGTAALLGDVYASTDTLSVAIPDMRQGQSVSTHLSHWGIFEKAYVRTTQRKKTFVRCSLLGTGILAKNRPSLYLAETNKPLAVVGDTHIEGDANLPEQGIRPGNIAGYSYYGTQLLFGTMRKSTADLPRLRYNYIDELNYYIEEFQPEIAAAYIRINQNSKVINSFNGGIKGYVSDEPVVLENVSIWGNIIIRSAQRIVIKKTANLKDIILAAPVIIIEDGVKGNFQAIADKTIKVGKSCSLAYPSALVLIKSKNSTDAGIDAFANKIYVDENSFIAGSICYLAAPVENDYNVNIFIDHKSSVKGEIYCNGNIELRGKVTGTVYAGQFLTNESGSTFVNHLYNVEISNADLPESFGGILMEGESKTIIKWLY